MDSKSSQDSRESDAFGLPYKRDLYPENSISNEKKKFLKENQENHKNVWHPYIDEKRHNYIDKKFC